MNIIARTSSAVMMLLLGFLAAGCPGVSAAVGPFAIIRNVLQNNIVGAPVAHRVTTYDFDPDVAIRRREQYYEVNGFRGEKLIERLGLGVDGYAAERLAQQQARDAGKLGGVLALQPSDQI